MDLIDDVDDEYFILETPPARPISRNRTLSIKNNIEGSTTSNTDISDNSNSESNDTSSAKSDTPTENITNNNINNDSNTTNNNNNNNNNKNNNNNNNKSDIKKNAMNILQEIKMHYDDNDEFSCPFIIITGKLNCILLVCIY